MHGTITSFDATALFDCPEVFKTQDSVGCDSSIFLRAIRQLAHHGKPIGQLVLLTAKVTDQKRMPIGMLTRTKKNRIVFWPVLPPRSVIVSDTNRIVAPDHITLEFPSRKLHVTAYDSNGMADHSSGGWKCSALDASMLDLGFLYLVQMPVILNQDVQVQRKYAMPSSDKMRREKEFAALAQSMVPVEIPLPRLPSENEYLCFGFYLIPGMISKEQLPSSLFPGQAMAELLENWPKDSEYPVLAAGLTLGERHLLIAAACPPGELKDPVCFGFPQAIPS
jgi:hypothetical protein